MLFSSLVAAPAAVVLCSVMGSTNKQLIHHVLDSPTVQREETRQEKACKKLKKTLLIQQYDSFTVKPGESLTDLYNRFSTLINDLKLFGKTYDNYEINHKFIMEISDSWEWDIITSVVRDRNDIDVIPLAKLFDILNKHHLDEKKEKLIRKYHEFSARLGESITEIFDRFNKLVNDLGVLGRTCDNYEVNIKFLQALPSCWDKRAVAIRVCNDMDAMTLRKLYEKLNKYEMRDRKEVLVRKYHEFIAKPGESMSELYDRFNGLVNELRLLGRVCDNYEVNSKFIQALPRSWDKWTVHITTCNDMDDMPLQDLYWKLKVRELKDQQKKELRQYHKNKALVEGGVDSDNSDTCSRRKCKLRSKLYTSKH